MLFVSSCEFRGVDNPLDELLLNVRNEEELPGDCSVRSLKY